MLGPSVFLAGLPLALGAAFWAYRQAPDRPFAVAALVVSLLEGLFLTALVVLTATGILA